MQQSGLVLLHALLDSPSLNADFTSPALRPAPLQLTSSGCSLTCKSSLLLSRQHVVVLTVSLVTLTFHVTIPTQLAGSPKAPPQRPRLLAIGADTSSPFSSHAVE